MINQYKVQLRGGFSDRNKIKEINTDMQYKTLDERTRTALINTTDLVYFIVREKASYYEIKYFWRDLLADVYSCEVSVSTGCEDKIGLVAVNQTIRNDDYDDVLTVIEYITREFSAILKDNNYELQEFYNKVFKKEYVGYRFVGNMIVPITSELEIDSISDAINSPYSVVSDHIEKATQLISDREKPDYANSIKESISAVEALCEIITETKGKGATLGKMLKEAEKNGIIHSSMKAAFSSLYGYTSDAKGIRHAGDIGGPSATFEDAKFMLVSCSAFVNYIIGVTSQK